MAELAVQQAPGDLVVSVDTDVLGNTALLGGFWDLRASCLPNKHFRILEFSCWSVFLQAKFPVAIGWWPQRRVRRKVIARQATCHPPARAQEARALAWQTQWDEGVSYSTRKGHFLDLGIPETTVVVGSLGVLILHLVIRGTVRDGDSSVGVEPVPLRMSVP